MDFFAYFDGMSIEAFGSADPLAARRYINRRYKDANKVVIVPVSATKEDFEAARKRSIELAD
jgi:hypothetical protein